MKEKTFETIEELRTQAIKDDACEEGLEWLNKQKSLKKVFEEINLVDRVWCLCQGYIQFVDKCDWEKLDGYDWDNLLRDQPQFLSKCNFDKFDGYDWTWLLREQPKFADNCDWKKLNSDNWSELLRHQPQFADKCDFNKLTGYQLSNLLFEQPQLCKYKLSN